MELASSTVSAALRLPLMLAVPISVLGGCAVYQPPPAVLADGSVAYASPPAVLASAPVYSAAPYVVDPYPYYIGPPVSLGLWFGHDWGYRHRGWGGPYHGHGFGYGHGGPHRGWGGRRR